MTMSKTLREDFLEAMSRIAATVSVVTTDGTGGRAGATVSSMTSVSADGPKPVMLVCIHHQSPTAAAIRRNKAFCINVLRGDQSWVSDVFAGRSDQDDKFSGLSCEAGKTGAPRLPATLAAFDCRLVNAERVGTHYVMFAEVEDLAFTGKGAPLIYANRAYGTPVPMADDGQARRKAA